MAYTPRLPLNTRNPERLSRGPEITVRLEQFADQMERVDLFHALERLRQKFFESGPELDRAASQQLLEQILLLGNLLGIDTSGQMSFDNEIASLRDQFDAITTSDEITCILNSISVPEKYHDILTPVIEKIQLGRAADMQDHQIYRNLARTYHPDVSVLNADIAQETTKLIGQFIYDKQSGLFSF